MIGLCQICGKNPATIYDDDLELRVCGDCRASYVHGDEMEDDREKPADNNSRIESALIIATLTFAVFIVFFVAEPSRETGILLLTSMIGYGCAAAFANIRNCLRCTKRYGVTCKISKIKFTFGSPKKDYGSTTFESNSRAPDINHDTNPITEI